MAKRTNTISEAKNQLWTQLDETRVSMLSVNGSSQHPQPMTHFVDKDQGVVWYITSAETDLIAAIDNVSLSQLVLMTPAQDYQASVSGRLEIVKDDAKLDELWNVAVAAWFEHGRDDENVRLLRFSPDEAAIWASNSSKIMVGLKMLTAGMQEGKSDPDVGVHEIIDFNQAA